MRPSGAVLFDDGGELEATAVQFGHYPDGRSDAKGIEAESLVDRRVRIREFMFVGSERGAFVAVYRLDGGNRPRFVQLLSTGQGPEGLLTIPARNLFVTANEGDDADGSISIFEGVPGRWDPSRISRRSSRAASTSRGERCRGWPPACTIRTSSTAVPDNALPTSIYSIHVGDSFARIRDRMPVTRGGTPVLFDLEGIAVDTSIARPRKNAGFWLASEGNATATRNTLIQVDGKGEILREIFLPAGRRCARRASHQQRLRGRDRVERRPLSPGGRPAPLQRGDDCRTGLPVLYTRIARYDLELEKWEAFFYPLESSTFTIGLSEIVVAGTTRKGQDVYAVIERDNQLAANGQIKRVYTFTLEGLAPEDIATPVSAASIAGSTVTKRLLRDVQPQFTPYEKVEGLAVTWGGDLWVVLDNDGGEFESRLVRYRKLLR